MEVQCTRSIPPYRSKAYKCTCPEPCLKLIEFLDPMDQERILVLCEKQATAYAYDILKRVGVLKTSPLEGRIKVDKRRLNKNWTTLEEQELISFLKDNGVIYGGYRMFAELHGKTVHSVKEKVRSLRKEGRIPPSKKREEQICGNG